MSSTTRVTAEFIFGASHRLPRYDGPCFNLHGHNYHLFVSIEGPVDAATGMVIDFVKLKEIVRARVLARVDHGDLNAVLENPTAELFAAWVWNEIRPDMPGLVEIRVDETADCSVVYRGN